MDEVPRPRRAARSRKSKKSLADERAKMAHELIVRLFPDYCHLWNDRPLIPDRELQIRSVAWDQSMRWELVCRAFFRMQRSSTTKEVLRATVKARTIANGDGANEITDILEELYWEHVLKPVIGEYIEVRVVELDRHADDCAPRRRRSREERYGEA